MQPEHAKGRWSLPADRAPTGNSANPRILARCMDSSCAWVWAFHGCGVGVRLRCGSVVGEEPSRTPSRWDTRGGPFHSPGHTPSPLSRVLSFLPTTSESSGGHGRCRLRTMAYTPAPTMLQGLRGAVVGFGQDSPLFALARWKLVMRTLLPMLVLVLALPSVTFGQATPPNPTGGRTVSAVQAQEPATPVPPAQERHERFLGLEVIAGGVAYDRTDYLPVTTGDESDKDHFGPIGWDLGATVNYGVRWVGIAGSVGRHTIETVPTYQFAVGPRFTTPRDYPIRFFAHVLVGFARTSGVTPSQGSAERVIGAGIDFGLLRIQIDEVTLNLDGLLKGNMRMFVGGFVPLCFRGCRDGDFINVSGRKRTR